MAKTLWDINFSTLNVTNERANGWGTKYTHTDNLTNGVYKADGQGSTPSFALNAVDIDWNGATLDSTVISTTGDLLKYIKAKSNLTLGTTSTTAAAGNHTHSNYLTKVLKLEKKGTSTIDLLANTTYTLTVGDQTLVFKTPTDQTGGGGTTVTDGSNILTWGSNVTLATVGGVAIDAKLPANPVTSDAIANLGFTKNVGTVTKVKVGNTEYTPSSGLITLPAYPTVPTYSQGTNITINSNTISHATPSGASSGNKGNKTTALLAYITTDSQGHVTGYQTITPSELWSLLKSYADALYEPKSTTVAVTGISLDKSSLSVAANGTGTITATIAPSNATNKNVNWTSSNTSIATVTGSTTSGNAATVTWKAAGSVTITATAAGNTAKTAQCSVTCGSATVAVTGISLNKSSLSVAANGTGTITATIAPSNATNKNVNWTSSNTSIATVTGSTTSGNAATVTWKAAGSVTITATAAGNTAKTAQCSVTCGSVQPTTTYYSYVGTDTSGKLVNPSTGALKSDIATQIKTISGVKTYNSVPSSLTTGTTIVANDYVYVIAPTSTLNRASVYLTNTSGGTIGTETLGTFSIGSTEYTVKCTPSEVGTVLTAWK